MLAVKAHQIAAIADRLDAVYHDDTVVVPVQNGLPWWFFQKFPGPFEGRRLDSLDPDGTIERHIPTDRIIALHRLSGRRTGQARGHPPRRR